MKAIPFLLGTLVATGAMAHVMLDEPRGEAGTRYEGVLRVGHGCDGSPTTALSVRLPAQVRDVRATARNGWSVATRPGEVEFTAAPGAAIAADAKGEFGLAMNLPRESGPLWLQVQQRCEKGSVAWSQMPSQGTSTAGLKTPAVLLEVMSAQDLALARALPRVDNAWVRASVPGQQATGAFMKLTAKEPMELVGVTTPVAGTAEVHEMKMEGDVMHMRPAGAIALAPGQTLELKPGGYHLMLQDLKRPLDAGSKVPLTLLLRNAKGAQAHLDLELPVAAQPPAGSAAGGMEMHKH
jgi:copper(I)-binding protein